MVWTLVLSLAKFLVQSLVKLNVSSYAFPDLRGAEFMGRDVIFIPLWMIAIPCMSSDTLPDFRYTAWKCLILYRSLLLRRMSLFVKSRPMIQTL